MLNMAMIALVSLAFSRVSEAAPDSTMLVTELERALVGQGALVGILEAAKKLFWALASMSLVWTMGMLIVRQDIGEALMELLRFMLVTGTFYWLLINASEFDGGAGFVGSIVQSFFDMRGINQEAFKTNADNVLWLGLHVYYDVMLQTEFGEVGDKILAGLMGAVVLISGALMSAQFLLALIMAWLLGYSAIFLLGFGGARWTSPIAIAYYKHVLAVGIAILCLSLIGSVASTFLQDVLKPGNTRGVVDFRALGATVASFVLLTVLTIRVPQLIYTLVTGSTLGLFAGTAGVIGSTIAISGGAAMTAAGRGGAPGQASPGGGSGGGGSGRTESATDAVQRSASSMASAGDPFHVGSGSDPFGVPRAARQSGGSAFATPPESTAMPTTTGTVVAAVSAFGRDNGMSDHGVPHGDQLDAVPIDGPMSTVRHEHDDRSADPARYQPDYEAELSAISASRADAR